MSRTEFIKSVNLSPFLRRVRAEVLYEIKPQQIGIEIVGEMKEKIGCFVKPREYGIAPILIHIGGVTESVYSKRYFCRIIDIADFLEEKGVS